jgi:hypothetical protein
VRVMHVVLVAVVVVAYGTTSSAQSVSIMGVVLDARTERPLRFSLSVPPAQYVLGVSLVGYAMTRQPLDVTNNACSTRAAVVDGHR